MTKYKVLWTSLATTDLDDIITYISYDNIDEALKILNLIQEKANALFSFPDKGRIVPELDFYNIKQYREIISSPWRIIYRIDKDVVYVLAVIDGRRNVEDILLKRLLSK